jgi:hypothetical protein
MKADSVKRRPEAEIRKEDFGLILERTIAKVGFISSALLEHPHEFDKKSIRAVSGLLGDIEDDLEKILQGHFQGAPVVQ